MISQKPYTICNGLKAISLDKHQPKFTNLSKKMQYMVANKDPSIKLGQLHPLTKYIKDYKSLG